MFVDEILAAPDYYRVLGVKKDCTPEEVRRAYIKVVVMKTLMLWQAYSIFLYL